LVLLTVIPVLVLVLPMWRVSKVEVEGECGLPPAAVHSLNQLVGRSTLGIDVDEIRDEVRVWPVVGEVEVELLLPGTIRVRVTGAEVFGSVQVGRGWHGVCGDGRLAGVLGEPIDPVLIGFGAGHVDRKRGLEVAGRLAAITDDRVVEVRRVTPVDFQVRIEPVDGGRTLTVHVRPEGSGAEGSWFAARAEGKIFGVWADLRWGDRMVLGGNS
jgi:hypothetical protein